MRYYAGSDSSPAHHAGKVSPLTPSCLPRIPLPTPCWACSSLCPPSQRQHLSGLRPTIAGSPHHPAETDSSTYGLRIRLLLLPTPSPTAGARTPPGRQLNDAVTLGFTWYGSMRRGLAPR